MSAQTGRTSTTRPSPVGTANSLALVCHRGPDVTLTWDQVLDAAVVAYWTRRPTPTRRIPVLSAVS